LFDFVFPAEGKLCSEELRKEYCMLGSRLAAYEMLKLGTTTACEMYYGEDDITAEFLKAGLRSVMSTHAIGSGRSEDEVEKLIRKCTNYVEDLVATGNESYVQASYSAHSLYTLHAKYHARLHEHQKKYNRPYFMHLNETEAEGVNCMMNSFDCKTDAVHQLNDTGLINPRFIGVHSVHLSDADIAILSQNRANICHCPRSNLKLGSGVARIPELMASGVNVCLGTDSACSNNSLDMLGEVQMAALIHKGHRQNPTAISAYQALAMATRNGAKAIGRLHELGSLEVGKLADMVNVDLSFFGDRLILDPISEVVYTTTRRVNDVFIGGRQVVKNGECLTVKLDDNLIKHLDSVIYKLQMEAKLRTYNKQKENKMLKTHSSLSSAIQNENVLRQSTSSLSSIKENIQLKKQSSSNLLSPRTEATAELVNDGDVNGTYKLVDEVVRTQGEEDVIRTPVARSESSASSLSSSLLNGSVSNEPTAKVVEDNRVADEDNTSVHSCTSSSSSSSFS